MSKSANDLEKLTKEKLIAKAKRMKVIVSSPMLKREIIVVIAKAIKSAERARKAAAKKVTMKKTVVAKKTSARKSAVKPMAKASAKKSTSSKPSVKAKLKKTVKAKSSTVVSSAKKSAAPKKAVKTAKPAVKASAKKTASSKPSVKAKSTTAASSAKKSAAPKKAVKTAKPVAKAVKTKIKASKLLSKSKPVAAVAKPKSKKSFTAPAALPSGKDSAPWDIKAGGKKFFIADEVEDYSAPEPASSDLPESYGDTRIVTLARSPHTLYVYWEAGADNVEQAKFSLGKDWSEISWVLRVYDVTDVEFDESNANYFFDVDIDSVTRSRYVDIERSGRDYIVAIGLKDNKGNFSRITLSNKVHAPRDEISGTMAPGWTIPDETFLKLYALSGGGSAGLSSLGGSEVMVPLEEISSGAVSSFSASEQRFEEKERGFSFWLNCELIVYGGTKPDAEVTMMGKRIQLRPDGTFSARFALPDGVIDIPVKAVSGDRVELREISPTVTRNTRTSKEMYPDLDDTPEKLSRPVG